MPEPDCFLRYRIGLSAATRNFTSGKSDVCVLAAAATGGFTMVLFTEPVSRRNIFVGGTCPSSWSVDFTLLFVYPYSFGRFIFRRAKIQRRVRIQLSAAAWRSNGVATRFGEKS